MKKSLSGPAEFFMLEGMLERELPVAPPWLKMPLCSNCSEAVTGPKPGWENLWTHHYHSAAQFSGSNDDETEAIIVVRELLKDQL